MAAASKGALRGAEQQFGEDWRALGAPRRMLLAVSGGADSIALMRLAATLRESGAALHVATVDHGLRAASDAETQFVAGEAMLLGLSARVLHWQGAKPIAGVQASARGARYRLLAREAKRWRADAILTAHTADDQVETLLMRISHQTGARGLCGMARESFIADGAGPPLRLLRPLLGWRRAALRAYLNEVGASHIDDPSNEDLRFERVRVRQALARSARHEDAVGALLALAGRAGALQLQVERLQRARFAALSGAFHDDGSARLSAAGVDLACDGSLIARLLGAVGGGGHGPDAFAAARVLEAALAGRRTTLAGALIERRGSDLCFMREPSAVLGRKGEGGMAPILIAAGGRVLWDHRFIVENTLGVAAEIRPLGEAVNALCESTCAEAMATAPGLWIGAMLQAFPGDHGEGDKVIWSLGAERFARLVVRH